MARINISESLPVRTQFLFFTLFGDYILPLGGEVWTSSIVYLMGLLDISERAVRSTLSRMTRKGWVSTQKFGRRSKYVITPRGHALLEGGQTRIFEPIFTNWDTKWHIVIYSLPEKKRRRRHTLRKQLTWLGFGRLAPGTWISPHNRHRELKSLFSDLNVEEFVEQFSAIHFGPSSNQDLANQCWDLSELETQYKNFIEQHQSEFEEHHDQLKKKKCPTPKDCFIQQFWITHEFQAMPLKDPNLPITLLPSDWVGFIARNLLDQYREMMRPKALQFVKEVISGDGRPPTDQT